MCEQRQTRCCCPRRTLNIFNQPTEAIAFGIADTYRRIKHLLRDLSHSVQPCAASSQTESDRGAAVQPSAAASQHDSARELSLPTRVFDLISDVHQHLFSTGLENVAENLARELTWWTSTN